MIEFMSLPDEIIELVSNHCDEMSKLCLSVTCSRLNRLVKSKHIIDIKYTDLLLYGVEDAIKLLDYANSRMIVEYDVDNIEVPEIDSRIINIKDDRKISAFSRFKNLKMLDLTGSSIKNTQRNMLFDGNFKNYYDIDAYNDIDDIQSLKILKTSYINTVCPKYIDTIYLVNNGIFNDLNKLEGMYITVYRSPNLRAIYTDYSLTALGLSNSSIYNTNKNMNINTTMSNCSNVFIYGISDIYLSECINIYIVPTTKKIILCGQYNDVYIKTSEFILVSDININTPGVKVKTIYRRNLEITIL